jgi:hypothetical protein
MFRFLPFIFMDIMTGRAHDFLQLYSVSSVWLVLRDRTWCGHRRVQYMLVLYPLTFFLPSDERG